MKTSSRNSAFALAITLVLMVLVVTVIVAYLANTRTDRSSSSIYANQQRAKMIAESGLTAATKLLAENTRYGNYITAMPAPSPAPSSHYTEIYRPTNPADTARALKADDYLTFANAAGEILVSLASPTPGAPPIPQVDPRPTPSLVYPNPNPTPLPVFALTSPTPALLASNSYNFNQVVRLGGTSAGRLVDPDVLPAFGQWVRVRNSSGELIGRYAFFIEDESMKVNVNATGNNLGTPNLRINDLKAVPASTPASQIQEIDPTSVLPAADRSAGNAALLALGSPQSRLASKSTIALLDKWSSTEKYAHLLTSVSQDDNTTAKGWKRMDLNKVVADAEAVGTASAKVDAATKVANWIRDAWTGRTPLANLQYLQLFKDDRLRLQIAANIVDYIDQDSIPTDMGDVIPVDDSGFPYPEAIAVIGIEKMPYLVAVHVLYEASNGTFPGSGTGQFTVTLKMKLQFRFLNLFEADLDLANHIGSIEVQGVPNITKNGFDVFPTPSRAPSPAKLYTIPLASLMPVNPSPTPLPATTTTVPVGVDGSSDSGARTFQTGWLEDQTVTFTVTSSDAKPRFVAGKLVVRMLGKANERLDITTIAISPNPNGTGYNAPSSGNDSVGDFLNDSKSAARQIASINLTYGQIGTTTLEFGDPRFRSRLITERWRNILRTDKPRVDSSTDKAEASIRAYAFDWYDNIGDRPLSFIRNKPMLSIGELGHISAAEYPWRSIYLQHPERPTNTSQAGPKDDVPLRRSQAQDFPLLDLFRAGGADSRIGAVNVNTQQQFLPANGAIPVFPLQGLFLGVPLGTSLPSPTPISLTQSTPAAATPTPSPADRLSTGVNLLVNSTTVAPASGQFIGTNPLPYRIASISNKRAGLPGETATVDTSPARPYFTAGEIASTLSRLLSASESSDAGSSTSRSKVVYSALRSDPQSTTTVQFYRRDFQVEQAFREVSNSITTRGNVFRALYVGQSIKDQKDSAGNLGQVENSNEVTSEYLGEAYIQRVPTFVADSSISPDVMKTADSSYRILSQRAVTE